MRNEAAGRTNADPQGTSCVPPSTNHETVDLPVGSGFAVDVSFIIVTYNSIGFIDDCLASISRSQGDLRVEVLVVDNASLDGSADHVRAHWPEVSVFAAGWNSGFSRACNLGASQASGIHLFFLNGDAQLHPYALSTLHKASSNFAEPVLLAPRILNPDGSDQQTARTFPTMAALIWGRRSPLSRMFPNNRFTRRYVIFPPIGDNRPLRVDWVSGAALMINRATFDDLDGFDTGYFMYWEDADLCQRARDRGFQVWCVPGAHVTHAEGSSAGTTSPIQNRRFHQSAYRYVARHMLTGPAVVLRPLAQLTLLVRSAFVASLRRHRERSIHPRHQELDRVIL